MLLPPEYWITHLRMQVHVEGGAYSEVYRSPLILDKGNLPATFNGSRNCCTSIYFLLLKGQFSAFHRIKSDETWHFYTGGSLEIYELDKNGTLQIHFLGSNPEKGEDFQTTIQAGNWFASRVVTGEYVLAGCTVSPGFDFEDFELAEREILLNTYPDHDKLIRQLTR